METLEADLPCPSRIGRLIITHIFWDVFTNHGSKPSCIEETRYDLCFGVPLYRRLQKLVGNDKYHRWDRSVEERIIALRESPPENLKRVPGPRALLYYLPRDPELQELGAALPRSTRTIWKIL